MTVGEIYTQALLELDESTEDLHEFEQKFNHYLNIGYQIALRDYYKPQELMSEPLANPDDVPNLPEHAHHGLVDYICYRHLSSGNLAKQSRAQFYRQSFYEAMRMLHPQNSSPGKYVNFYEATNL